MITFRVGRSTSLTDTATGKTFLAFKERADVSATLRARGYRPLGAATLRELDTIRRRGFARSDTIHVQPGVALTGFGAIAVPIFGNDGEVHFVVTVLYRSTDDATTIAELAEKIRSSAHAVSLKSGKGADLPGGIRH